MKKIVLVDMDNVLAGFDSAITHGIWPPPEMVKEEFFLGLEPLPGAMEGIRSLLANDKLDVYIATKLTVAAPHAASEKWHWINWYIPELRDKMFIVCDKLMLRGDYLIDDDKRWADFKGEFICFDKTKPEKEWERIVKKLG